MRRDGAPGESSKDSGTGKENYGSGNDQLDGNPAANYILSRGDTAHFDTGDTVTNCEIQNPWSERGGRPSSKRTGGGEKGKGLRHPRRGYDYHRRHYTFE